MQARPSYTLAPTALAIAATVVVSLGTAADACAQTSPYYIGISQGFVHDSNVFRTASDVKADTYSSTGLIGGVDQPLGRQRFYATGSLSYNRYRDQKQLNNTSYGLNTGLDLQTINNLSGALNYSINQSLLNYGSASATEFTGKNLEKTQQLTGRASWGGVSLLGLDLTGTHRTLRYSQTGVGARPFDQDSASLGLTYRPSGLLSLGAALRATRGTYQAIDGLGFSLPESDFDRNDLDLTATWVPTGLSTVNARLSFGRQTYEIVSDRNRSNVTTGSLSWDYKPTGKLGFNLWLSRDTGAETTFFDRVATVTGERRTSVGDNSQLTNTLALRAHYAATAKISLNANARYARRSLENVFTDGAASISNEGKVSDRSLSLGVTYDALRSLQLGCSVAREGRKVGSTTTGQPLATPYVANTVNCFGQFTLR